MRRELHFGIVAATHCHHSTINESRNYRYVSTGGLTQPGISWRKPALSPTSARGRFQFSPHLARSHIFAVEFLSAHQVYARKARANTKRDWQEEFQKRLWRNTKHTDRLVTHLHEDCTPRDERDPCSLGAMFCAVKGTKFCHAAVNRLVRKSRKQRNLYMQHLMKERNDV